MASNEDENRTVGAPARSLEEIVKDLTDHERDNPTHGVSCVCMDKYIREVRNQVFAAVGPDDRTGLRERTGRVRWVLGVVVRGL